MQPVVLSRVTALSNKNRYLMRTILSFLRGTCYGVFPRAKIRLDKRLRHCASMSRGQFFHRGFEFAQSFHEQVVLLFQIEQFRLLRFNLTMLF